MKPTTNNKTSPLPTIKINIPQIQTDQTHHQQLPFVTDPSFRERWNSRQMDEKCGVSFQIVNNSKQIDYLNALAEKIDPSYIISIFKSDARCIVYFSNQQTAQKIMIEGLHINTQYVPGFPIFRRPTKVVITGIHPHIPDKPVVDFLNQFGKTDTDWLRPIPINTSGNANFTHIITHRREIYMTIEKELPKRLVIQTQVPDFNYVIYINSETNIKRDTTTSVQNRLQQNETENLEAGENSRILRDAISNVENELLKQSDFPPLNPQKTTKNLLEISNPNPISENHTTKSNDNPKELIEFASDEDMPSEDSSNENPNKNTMDTTNELPESTIISPPSTSSTTKKKPLLGNLDHDTIAELLSRMLHKKNEESKTDTINEFSTDYPTLIKSIDKYKSHIGQTMKGSAELNALYQRIDRLRSFITKTLIQKS